MKLSESPTPTPRKRRHFSDVGEIECRGLTACWLHYVITLHFHFKHWPWYPYRIHFYSKNSLFFFSPWRSQSSFFPQNQTIVEYLCRSIVYSSIIIMRCVMHDACIRKCKGTIFIQRDTSSVSIISSNIDLVPAAIFIFTSITWQQKF